MPQSSNTQRIMVERKCTYFFAFLQKNIAFLLIRYVFSAEITSKNCQKAKT